MVENNFRDNIVNYSRLSQSGDNPEEQQRQLPPTSGQKWWISIVMGIIFFIMASPLIGNILNGISFVMCISPLYSGKISFIGLLILSLTFTLIVRFILW